MLGTLFQTLLFLPTAFSGGWIDSTSLAHHEEVRSWHERRIRNLQRDYGWLTLVGLDWLKEGENQIYNVGTVTLHSGTISFTPNVNIKATVNDKPFSQGVIVPEGQNIRPDTVRIGSKTFVVIKRGDRYAIRTWDKESKARTHFNGITRYTVSLGWRIEARWEAYNPPKQIKVPTVIPGYVEDYPVPGVAIFSIGGKEYRLEPVLEEPDGDYFFIYGDKTNGKETYSAGRFLYSKRAKDGKVVLDFNKAYNPPCAFTEHATCPLPPPENKLPIEVLAGEKNYATH